MKTDLIIRLISVLLSVLPSGWVKRIVDAMLDVVEDLVAKTSTPIDDAIVLPIVKKIRDELGIPDDDN